MTQAVALHLRSCGWRVHSKHYPGAQGGVRLADDSGGSVVPDIVASWPAGGILIVESKAAFSSADCGKVRSTVHDTDYAVARRGLERRYALSGTWWAAHAFGEGSVGDVPAGVILLRVTTCGIEVHNAPFGFPLLAVEER
ncbi:MAG: hypothetical protein FJX75_24760 [Armatimonadetes bacterium]|nr:hypothetical protein [Armatimonadota bacterium]